MRRKILVLGGAHIDRCGRISGVTAPGCSNPGSWFVEAGGGGFNVARNLARLGQSVTMISPRGGDADGDAVASAAEAAGVEDRPFVFLDRKTPSYTAILERDGNLIVAFADMELYRLFSPRRMRVRQVRTVFGESDLIVTDANLPEETLAAAGEMASASGKMLAGIAISPAQVVRFRPILPAMHTLFMNEAEAAALSGRKASAMRDWPAILSEQGLSAGVVTAGRGAAIAFMPGEAVCVAPPEIGIAGDVTGAGDALAAGFLVAILAGIPVSQALRQGVAAALLAVRSDLAVAENMGPTALNESLALVPEAEVLS